MFSGLAFRRCSCSWWRKLLRLKCRCAERPVISSRYAPGSAPNYADLETAYARMKYGAEEPYLGVSSLRAMSKLQASNTGETQEEAYRRLVEHSDVVEVEGVSKAYRLRGSETGGTLWMHPEQE